MDPEASAQHASKPTEVKGSPRRIRCSTRVQLCGLVVAEFGGAALVGAREAQ